MPSKQAQQKWYQENKDYCRQKLRNRRIALAKFLVEYKTGKVCKLCPENHIACLDFHHRDRSIKLYSINEMISHGFALKKVIEEIEKCDLLCSNCHRKLHYNEGFHSRSYKPENTIKD